VKYVLLYHGGGMAEGEAEQAAVMQAWGEWFGSLGSAVVDAGAPFSGTAKSVSSERAVSDGGLGDAPSGYSVVESDSIDAAANMAKSCPIQKAGGQVAIYEVHDMT
jgi:hypothetical protein